MTERLDTETDAERQDRLSRLFASASVPAPPTRPTTFPVAPNSELLQRLQSFLPQMATANELLVERSADDLDIENVNEGEQYIEMDLGLGVFNARVKDGEEDEEDEVSSEDDDDDDESDSSSSGSSSDDDEGARSLKRQEAEIASREKPSMLLLDSSVKSAPSRGRPDIVMLEEAQSAASASKE